MYSFIQNYIKVEAEELKKKRIRGDDCGEYHNLATISVAIDSGMLTHSLEFALLQ